MGKQLIVATGNEHKMQEIRQILGDTDMELVTMKAAGIDIDIVEDGTTFEENAIIKARAVAQASGKTAIADDSGLVVDAMGGEPGIHSARWMGHDTSYEIKNNEIIRLVDEYCREHAADAGASSDTAYAAEAGADGMNTAGTASGTVYAAEAGSGSISGEDEKAEVHPGCEKDGTPGPMRSARFVCAVAIAEPDGTARTVAGVMEGRIYTKISGENGFGYDPIFFLPEYGMTSAEISPEEKNLISHRGKAFRALRDLLDGQY